MTISEIIDEIACTACAGLMPDATITPASGNTSPTATELVAVIGWRGMVMHVRCWKTCILIRVLVPIFRMVCWGMWSP